MEEKLTLISPGRILLKPDAQWGATFPEGTSDGRGRRRYPLKSKIVNYSVPRPYLHFFLLRLRDPSAPMEKRKNHPLFALCFLGEHNTNAVPQSVSDIRNGSQRQIPYPS